MAANPVVTSDVLDEELLTEREREILALIGSAMTNKEIARQLRISDHTVKTHLHHIYVKLEKSGRYKAFLSRAVAAPSQQAVASLASRPNDFTVRDVLRKQAPADFEGRG